MGTRLRIGVVGEQVTVFVRGGLAADILMLFFAAAIVFACDETAMNVEFGIGPIGLLKLGVADTVAFAVLQCDDILPGYDRGKFQYLLQI